MLVYIASSWRNPTQPAVVQALRKAGYRVYDFRHPGPDNDGFQWAEIDQEWEHWSPSAFIKALNDPIAKAGFGEDMQALRDADVVVLLMPCGRSAHLEMGWAIGAGKRTAIVLNGACEPELMYKMADHICIGIEELLVWLK